MLNPTVGIELQRKREVNRILRISDAQRKLYSLYSELSTLESRISDRWMFVMRQLTARTRKSEVFPAFCNPIMVMSISVALYNKQND